MALKQDIKQSEARVIILIKNVSSRLAFASHMAQKLEMDYAYLLKILQNCTKKGWIGRLKPVTQPTKVFYYLKDKTITDRAIKARLSYGGKK